MRAGASEFGPIALAAVRVTGALVLLLPLMLLRREGAVALRHWRALLVVGLANSAIPFLCFSFAALSMPAALLSVFNASTPLMGAMIAWLWLKDRMTAARAVGLGVGFAGVLWLVWSRSGPALAAGLDWHAVSPMLACLGATLGYGFAASFTKRYLADVPPVASAAGSQVAAALVLLGPAIVWWPAVPPSPHAWGAGLLLAVLCTGVAYVMFFRLIGQIGPARAISVTFMIPLFAALWGFLFLKEPVSLDMVLGCATILLGTALTTGALRWPQGKTAGLTTGR
ncbi:DMT family transporter [Rhizobacter sp. Root1221]|uniref:DMT family transporter n=1 Tax=Rhizobacter sp. Root1221 TaxID=1736433 RepID=UPI0009EB27C8